MMRPAASEPMDKPHVDIVTYHASTSDLLAGVVRCDMMDLVMLLAGCNIQDRIMVEILFDSSERAEVAACCADHACTGSACLRMSTAR